MLGAILMAAAGSLKYSGSMTAGTTGTFVGLLAGSFGSRSPTTLVDGKTFAMIVDDSSGPTCSVRVSGFSGDPGAGYLRFASANGVVKVGSAASYSYSGGAATWTWSGSFGFADTSSYPVVLA